MRFYLRATVHKQYLQPTLGLSLFLVALCRLRRTEKPFPFPHHDGYGLTGSFFTSQGGP